MGQLRMVIRSKFLIDAIGLNKIQGLPFKVREVVDAIEAQLDPKATESPPIIAQPQAIA
jgi:2-oxoglutarate ferredoxin oxidoreductase subunit alpha